MRYTQPQSGPVRIDWSNPLTRGLAIALAPGMPDAVSGSLAVQSGSSSLGTNQAGRAFASPATQTTGNFKYAVSIPSSFDCTLLRVHSCITANTPASGTPSLELNSAELVLACDTGAQSLFSTTGNPSGAISIAAAGNLSVIAGVKAVNSQLSYYNGKLLNTSATGNRAIGAITQVSIGRSSGNQFENVKYALVLYWTRALSATEIAQVSANPWLVFKSPQRVMMSTGGVAAALASDATAQAAATGALSTSIQMVGAAIAAASGTGALTSDIALAGTAVAQSAASGVVSTGIVLAGGANASAIATGALTAPGLGMSGAAACNAAAFGSLTTGILLVSAAGASAFASGALTTQIRLAGEAACSAIGVATLSGGVVFAMAPAGSGYTPQRNESQIRPASGTQSRPAATQRNNR